MQLLTILGLVLALGAWRVMAPQSLISYLPELQHSDPQMGVGTPHKPYVRLVTYNIRHGAGVDNRVDLERTASALMSINADVVFLTEVDSHWRRSGFVDQAEELAKMLSMPYIATAPALIRGTARYGNALLSRFPIVEAQRTRLPASPLQEPRVVLMTLVRLTTGEFLRIYGTHLGLSETDRLAQVEVILDLSKEHETEPRVLMGDFNASPGAPELQRLVCKSTSLWQDPLGLSTEPTTFPTHAPQSRIDYILISPDLAPNVKRYESPFTDASDHLPVLVDLIFEESGSDH